MCRRSSSALLRVAALCVGALALATAEFTPCPYNASAPHELMHCKYRGRLGNQLIQYAFCRLQAAKLGIEVAPSKGMCGPEKQSPAAWSPHFGARVTCLPAKGRSCGKDNGLHPAPEKVMAQAVAVWNDEPYSDIHFHQLYSYFRGRRDFVRYFLATADEAETQPPMPSLPPLAGHETPLKPYPVWRPSGTPPGPHEAVIQLRIMEGTHLCADAWKHGHMPTWPGHDLIRAPLPPGAADPYAYFDNATCADLAAAPPFEYFERVLAAARDTAVSSGVPWGRVHLVTEPRLRSTELAQQIVKRLNATIRTEGKDAYDDLWFVKSTRGPLVLTYGTYSWIAGFLSHASAVHTPITARDWSGTWSASTHLFVDDLPDYVYHDVERGRYFLTAEQVLADNTSFSRSVKARPRDLIGDCPCCDHGSTA
jgi:hypothetical protein